MDSAKPKVNGELIELDALIVGAGFGGVYQLKRLRERGFNAKLVECGSDFGGVWYWNRYPGARVDIAVPYYEFSDPQVWEDFPWTQRFPSSAELRAYFQHVADKWDLRKDSIFNTLVTSAVWDESQSRWTITTKNGPVFRARFFLPNTGFAAKRYTPDWKGIDSFQGTWIHPSYWPEKDLDVRGKKIAVIGTGSTGVQLTQALAPLASEFTLFQRTPNLATPMKQIEFAKGEEILPRDKRIALYSGRLDSYGGLDFNFLPIGTFEVSEEERKATFEKLWEEGDFHYWLATYHDTLFKDDANTEAYNFWREKVRARINDPVLQEKLAPTVKPHAFGCKRISLETGYFELFNRPNVHLVDVNETPVVEVTPRGIRTSEKEFDFDLIVCATGYDALTGGILQMGIKGKNGLSLNEKWKDGVKTYFGMCISGFPNMFFTYGPQGPTALCNGPCCSELQGEWVVNALEYLRDKKLNSLEATEASEKAWGEEVRAVANATLLPTTKSWYMGDNIPGKLREPYLYLGGVPTYSKKLHESAAGAYQEFEQR